MQQGSGVGLGVIDEDLQAGIERRAFAIHPAVEHTLEHLLHLLHGYHGAVHRLALHVLQGGAQQAKRQDKEGQDPENDEEETEPDALILRLRVLIRDPGFRHLLSSVRRSGA